MEIQYQPSGLQNLENTIQKIQGQYAHSLHIKLEYIEAFESYEISLLEIRFIIKSLIHPIKKDKDNTQKKLKNSNP